MANPESAVVRHLTDIVVEDIFGLACMVCSWKFLFPGIFLLKSLENWLVFLEPLVFLLFLHQVYGNYEWRLNLISVFEVIVQLFFGKHLQSLDDEPKREEWVLSFNLIFDLLKYTDDAFMFDHLFGVRVFPQRKQPSSDLDSDVSLLYQFP